MADELLRAGVSGERLILDEASCNTQQNVEAAAAEVVRGGHPYVVACSDAYHLPRVRLLLGLAGVASRAGPLQGRGGPPVTHLVGMGLREGLAIPHNIALVLARRARGRS
ncbi:MAG: hypothetical protein DI570_23540 [Phenylobacterium zucineum]|nr:MAG: hypothetical protein DI570_23540 [Phenylobacterium zucineum]